MNKQGNNNQMVQAMQSMFGGGDGQDSTETSFVPEVRKLKRNLLLLLLTFLALVLLAPGGPLQAAPAMPEPADRSIYIFGDSWAQLMAEVGTPIPFDNAVADRDFDSFITLHRHAISGSTLAEWASDSGGRLTTLATSIAMDTTKNPIAFFTLGGNDVRNDATPEQMAANLAMILNALQSTRADLEIYYGGYDFLNPNINGTCMIGTQITFGTTDPALINPQLLAAYQGAALVANSFDRTTAVNTFGTLQGNPGMPDPTMWSPVEYVSADCLHLNRDGYELYVDALFDLALTAEICSDLNVTSTSCPLRKHIFLPLIMAPAAP